ncbi:MAG: DNA repair exonuclease [Tissierellia bacterium]|nr:DNA repair exonuclease [Tissierellia bacterium]
MRFFHVADLHLGRRFRQGHGIEMSRKRREELWKAFEEIIINCKKESIDALFLSGDIYEREYFTISDYHRLGELLESLAPIKVFIIGGNHDFLRKDSYLLQMNFSKHITIFSKESVEYYDWEEKNIRIMGFSWNSALWNKKVEFQNFPILDNGDNILLLHGTLNGNDYLPFQERDLKHFTYIALGHIHKPFLGNNMAYPGSTVPMSFKDIGNHGYISGVVENGKSQFEYRPLSYRFFQTIDYSLKDSEDFMEVFHTLKEKMNEANTCYRIKVTGDSPEFWSFEELEESLKPYGDFVEIIDETESPWDIEYLLKGEEGEFISHFIEYIASSDESEEIKNLGIKIGLMELKGDSLWKY